MYWRVLRSLGVKENGELPTEAHSFFSQSFSKVVVLNR